MAPRTQSAGSRKTAKAGTATNVPKRPYYQTYWGYEAALRVDPDFARVSAPITLAAIDRHFGQFRWLKVIREYSFSSGPRKSPELAESVRHTARAAELTLLLAPEHRRVSEVAWDLVNEAGSLQYANGGWREFRDTLSPPALWATVYVYRLLAKLALGRQASLPVEREAFLEKVAPLLSASESYLADLWLHNRWEIEGSVAWNEGTAAVLGEVGALLSDDSLVLDAYNALRSTLTPAGRLFVVDRAQGQPSETSLGVRVAFALKSCGRDLTSGDARYQRLVSWLADSVDPSKLTTYDIAFASSVLELVTPV